MPKPIQLIEGKCPFEQLAYRLEYALTMYGSFVPRDVTELITLTITYLILASNARKEGRWMEP